mmetsp:Transcript_25166/g.59153  ORF Transcript_25166/g.59153 Transcript_25166/m.59153 type:complete len:225 (+) Transcript_25166:98-772(+)
MRPTGKAWPLRSSRAHGSSLLRRCRPRCPGASRILMGGPKHRRCRRMARRTHPLAWMLQGSSCRCWASTRQRTSTSAGSQSMVCRVRRCRRAGPAAWMLRPGASTTSTQTMAPAPGRIRSATPCARSSTLAASICRLRAMASSKSRRCSSGSSTSWISRDGMGPTWTKRAESTSPTPSWVSPPGRIRGKRRSISSKCSQTSWMPSRRCCLVMSTPKVNSQASGC